MKLSIAGIVGINIDSSYKWLDTLYFNNEAASKGEAEFKQCKSYIDVVYANELNLNGCREIEDNIFIGKDFVVDKNFNTRIEKTHLGYKITATQECNEWLIVCFQLLLLENGYSLIHAAGLEKNKKATLLPSWGRVGKTATVVRMTKEKGWKLLGDDLLIINSEGNVIPFLKPFVIYGYHEPLFPELFEGKKGIIRNHVISDTLRRFIPMIKKVLGTVPGILAYARKHNPHSMRINPSEIFRNDQLSKGARVDQVTWLERLPSINENMSLNTEQIVSKIVSVTILEVFNDRINAVNIMCGSGLLDFNNLYTKMNNILFAAFEGLSASQLTISTSVPIENVGTEVMRYIDRENN